MWGGGIGILGVEALFVGDGSLGEILQGRGQFVANSMKERVL
jgi:hypothetical protein